MSVSGISSSSYLSQSVQSWQAKAQKIQSEFQQLGQDLQAGSLTQAQSDFSMLSQNVSSPLQSNSALAQAFGALGSALQSGNLSAAQQAYTTLQQDVQQAGQGHHHHHHHGEMNSQTTNSSGSTLSQLFSSLGSALQSGNLSAAQTAYSTLSQDLQQLSQGAGTAAQLATTAVSFLG
jgi:Skp family chaperone for outer membrane proteins